jgi:amidase
MRIQPLQLSIILSFAYPFTSASIPPLANLTDSPVNITQTLQTPFPYDFPNQNADAAGLFPMPPCNGTTIEEATIDQLQGYMNQGLLTSVQLALCYLDRHWQTGDYIK